MSQTSVLNWILDNNPWFLISVSSSEGFPVSMQESLISGVPILAAANGGMVEAVEMSNGYLLPETPTYMDFEKAMLHVLSLSNEEILEARQIALNVGNAHFLR
jgi:glycosyltransferase involved in cell wall biosynthesis